MSKSLKQRGEDAAVAFLERTGMTIVDRRWSCDSGLIDVIALDGDWLVLVDVRTVQAGLQKELGSVSAAVARRINRIAIAYIEASSLSSIEWRYDEVTLLVISEDRALLRHHRQVLAASE